MNSSELNDLLEEATGSLDPIAILIEGLEDYLRLDLRKESLEQVGELLEAYKRRSDILTTLARALSDTKGIIDALVSDGHPDLPLLEVNQEIMSDLVGNLSGMKAALAKFQATRVPSTAQVTITGPGVIEPLQHNWSN